MLVVRDNIGKVAPAAAGDADLLSNSLIPLEQEHRPSPLSRLDGTHAPCRAGAKYDDIVHVDNITLIPVPQLFNAPLRVPPSDLTISRKRCEHPFRQTKSDARRLSAAS